MGTRAQLSQILRDILGSGNVYFQPPPTVQMKYPAIVYEKTSDDTKRADNKLYARTWAYTVTVIDKDPDTTIPDRIAELPMCKLNRAFAIDNLNHYVFKIYF